jgi:hypothetical protein
MIRIRGLGGRSPGPDRGFGAATGGHGQREGHAGAAGRADRAQGTADQSGGAGKANNNNKSGRPGKGPAAGGKRHSECGSIGWRAGGRFWEMGMPFTGTQQCTWHFPWQIVMDPPIGLQSPRERAPPPAPAHRNHQQPRRVAHPAGTELALAQGDRPQAVFRPMGFRHAGLVRVQSTRIAIQMSSHLSLRPLIPCRCPPPRRCLRLTHSSRLLWQIGIFSSNSAVAVTEKSWHRRPTNISKRVVVAAASAVRCPAFLSQRRRLCPKSGPNRRRLAKDRTGGWAFSHFDADLGRRRKMNSGERTRRPRAWPCSSGRWTTFVNSLFTLGWRNTFRVRTMSY